MQLRAIAYCSIAQADSYDLLDSAWESLPKLSRQAKMGT